jgi:RecB family exonuclease
VYLGRANAGGPTERDQDALTPESVQQWRDLVGQAAAATQGPQYTARINDGCAHCPVRSSCPAQSTRQDRS